MSLIFITQLQLVEVTLDRDKHVMTHNIPRLSVIPKCDREGAQPGGKT
jgi:hypothetical protein